MERGSEFYAVRKGSTIAVYKDLDDCQAQVSTSVCDPAVSAYKGHSWSKETEDYLSSHGLHKALYSINATDLREDLFGTLVPCSFQEMAGSSSSRPNRAEKLHDQRYQTGALPTFLSHEQTGSGGTSVEHLRKPLDHGYSVERQPVYRQEAKSSPSAHLLPNNLNLGYAVSVQTISQQCEAKSSTSTQFLPNNLNLECPVNAQPLSQQHMLCILEFDGASKGNPGKAGAGAVLRTEDGRVISRLREGLGVVTNNFAEYRGLILGLRYALMKGFKRIKVNGDSQLVCMQVQGLWQTKKQNMMDLCKEVNKLKEKFLSFEISHVRREWNADADRQANIAINLATGQVSEERGEGF